MAESASNGFCPVYKNAIAARPWEQLGKGNAGLIYDKFGNAWQWNGESGDKKAPRFDKAMHNLSKRSKSWLDSFVQKHGTSEQLESASQRQYKLVKSLGGEMLYLTNESRFVSGMGRQHPLENGFTWHHTLGAPYLPASGLKGVLRTWYREEVLGNWDSCQNEDKCWQMSCDAKDVFGRLFGNEGQIGDLIFFDLLPVKPVQLTSEIMTPHYGDYYQNREIPGDWMSPVPITYLAVAEAQFWQLGIAPRSSDKISREQLDEIIANLFEALRWLGLGAKTAIGMGRFELSRELEEQITTEREKSRLADVAISQQIGEQKKFEHELESASHELKQLKKLQREKKWRREAGDQNMISALNEFADANPNPPSDSIAWICEFLASIPNYTSVWDQPDAKMGKKQDKDKYSKTIRELVKKLNPKFRNQ